MSIELVIWGAGGRMGRRLIALASEDPKFKIVRAIEDPRNPCLGRDAGEVAGIPALQIPICDSLDLSVGHVIIDFSHPSGISALHRTAIDSRKALVCGTTGLSDAQIELLRDASQHIPVLVSPNMSIGINLMFIVARQIAQSLGADFDVEICELHHRFKRDAPSGTALRLAQEIADARGLSLAQSACCSREGTDIKRLDSEIGIQSIRGGDIAGEHTALFCGTGERLEITHRATNRDIFVRGALKAAAWLHTQSPGFYSMFDVLSLSKT